MPSGKYKMIHIKDPADGHVRPLIIKAYKTGKKNRQLILGKQELIKNAKHLPQYGGIVGPLVGSILANTLPSIGMSIGSKLLPGALSKIGDFGMGKILSLFGGAIDPNQLPRTESEGAGIIDDVMSSGRDFISGAAGRASEIGRDLRSTMSSKATQLGRDGMSAIGSMGSIITNAFLRGLKKKSGGRIYLGKGLTKKIVLSGPEGHSPTEYSFPGTPAGAKLETYTVGRR